MRSPMINRLTSSIINSTHSMRSERNTLRVSVCVCVSSAPKLTEESSDDEDKEKVDCSFLSLGLSSLEYRLYHVAHSPILAPSCLPCNTHTHTHTHILKLVNLAVHYFPLVTDA